MKHILVHGLGQNETSWNSVKTELEKNTIKTETPNLYEMISNQEASYKLLLKKFIGYCNTFDEPLNLCGLSLGGMLTLDYAKQFPQKVNSIILIGTPYIIPKLLFKIQKLIFYLIPQNTFLKMGLSKQAFISLINSMNGFDNSKDLDKIEIRTLILCGSKDAVNKTSAEKLHEHIKGSSLIIVENASHEINTDNPKKLSEIINAFWTEKTVI